MGRLAAGPSTWTAFINQKQTTSAPFPRAPSSVESATVSIHENDSTPPCDCSQHNFNMSEGVPKNMRHPDGAYVRSSSWQKVTLLWTERDANSHFCTCSKWHPAVSDVIFRMSKIERTWRYSIFVISIATVKTVVSAIFYNRLREQSQSMVASRHRRVVTFDIVSVVSTQKTP